MIKHNNKKAAEVSARHRNVLVFTVCSSCLLNKTNAIPLQRGYFYHLLRTLIWLHVKWLKICFLDPLLYVSVVLFPLWASQGAGGGRKPAQSSELICFWLVCVWLFLVWISKCSRTLKTKAQIKKRTSGENPIVFHTLCQKSSFDDLGWTLRAAWGYFCPFQF